MSALTTLDITPPIARLSLNRPEARNALSIDLLEELNARARDLAQRREATVLLLAGTGKAFCAGLDLKAVLSDPAGAKRLLHLLADFTLALRALPMVTLAKVNGAAIGGGCGIACASDIAITHADAKLGFPEVDLGICPAVVAPWVVRKVGVGRARKILLTGGLLSGKDAFDLGVVDLVVENGPALDDAAEKAAQRLGAGGPNALRATKDLLNRVDGSLDTELVKRGADLSASVLLEPETQAILKAKFEKQP